VITAPFEYRRAGSLAEAVSLLVEYGEDAKLLAGGHSLLPMMKLRLAFPSALIDIRRVEEAAYLRRDGTMLAIGALTRHCDLVSSELLREQAPLLARAASLVGDPQIRHRGTLGGSLAHADPAADLPAAVLASDAVLVALGPSGRREIPAADFFRGYFETALQPAEVLAEIRVPLAAGQGWHYEKFVRRANDWAIVAVATVAGRIALANMASTPVRATAAERALADGASAAEAAELAAEGTEPVTDLNADSDYRRHLARVLTRRALLAAAAPAQ
jgi:carbon-monoxide dehydrogenase medium subunit